MTRHSQRNFRRIPVRTQWTLDPAEGNAPFRATGLNLSSDGFCVAFVPKESLPWLRLGHRLRFSTVLPTGEVIGLAEVVRIETEASSVGLKLISIENPDGLSNLLSYVTSELGGAGPL